MQPDADTTAPRWNDDRINKICELNRMRITLYIWRQQDSSSPGNFVRYEVDDITPDLSFLEMLDVLNEDLVANGQAPVAFAHD